MATSTIHTYLLYKATTSATAYTKLCDIKDYPKIEGQRDILDTTTLSDKSRTGIAGMDSLEVKSFKINYDPDVLTTIKALDGQDLPLALAFGKNEELTTSGTTWDAAEGAYTFTGQVKAYANEGSVNAVREGTVDVYIGTVPAFVETLS